MIVTMFPEPREQAKAIGVFSFVASAGGSVGLLAGGVLTQSINWHWIFFVNVPIGIATALLALRYVAADRGAGFGRGADVVGAALITAALMLLVYTIVKPAAEDGWGAGTTLAFGAGALALLVAFLAREATAANPLIPLRVFRSREVAGANAIQALLVAAMFGTFFLGSLYLERVLRYKPLEIGLAFLPLTLVMGGLSLRYSERIIMRFGARRTLVPGLTLMGAAMLLFGRSPVHATYIVDVLPVMLLIGVGVAISGPSLMTLAMSGATPEDAGLASGLINTTTQVGGALGLAVLATLAASHSGSSASPSALTSGYHLAYLLAAGLIVGGIAIAATVLRPRAAHEAPPVEHAACAEAA
jgi:MFS family permease